jgi:hypothetical protein
MHRAARGGMTPYFQGSRPFGSSISIVVGAFALIDYLRRFSAPAIARAITASGRISLSGSSSSESAPNPAYQIAAFSSSVSMRVVCCPHSQAMTSFDAATLRHLILGRALSAI